MNETKSKLRAKNVLLRILRRRRRHKSYTRRTTYGDLPFGTRTGVVIAGVTAQALHVLHRSWLGPVVRDFGGQRRTVKRRLSNRWPSLRPSLRDAQTPGNVLQTFVRGKNGWKPTKKKNTTHCERASRTPDVYVESWPYQNVRTSAMVLTKWPPPTFVVYDSAYNSCPICFPVGYTVCTLFRGAKLCTVNDFLSREGPAAARALDRFRRR